MRTILACCVSFLVGAGIAWFVSRHGSEPSQPPAPVFIEKAGVTYVVVPDAGGGYTFVRVDPSHATSSVRRNPDPLACNCATSSNGCNGMCTGL